MIQGSKFDRGFKSFNECFSSLKYSNHAIPKFCVCICVHFAQNANIMYTLYIRDGKDS
jgi:hypothetical protein